MSSSPEVQRPSELQDARAVVVGGAGGIGRGIVAELRRAGAEVLIGDLETTDLREVAREFDAHAGPLDLTDPGSVEAFASTALAKLGSIEILVNSAGVLTTAPVVDLPLEDWDLVMSVNARGVFLTCRSFVPHMVAARRGSIVNIASINGKRGDASLAHYSASKFAVIGFTQSLASEVASDGVRVNAICPGSVQTPMLEDLLASSGRSVQAEVDALQLIDRPQRPDEIGRAVIFLSTADSITGQAINVDGGCHFH